jgi:PAS domain S-box-containing protein
MTRGFSMSGARPGEAPVRAGEEAIGESSAAPVGAVASARSNVVVDCGAAGPPAGVDGAHGRGLRDGLAEQALELERLREALRESEDRFRVLVSNIPGAVYRRLLDPTMTLEFVSDAIEAITGHSAPSLTGNYERAFASVIHPDDRGRIAEEVRAAVDAGRHYGLAYRIVRADGEEAWVGDRGQAVAGGDGDAVRLYGTLSDITQRKRLEADGERMELELRMAQKLEAVGQLAAGIAHEINTPIQFVGDSLQFLREAFEDLDRLVADYREACNAEGAGPGGEELRARLERAEEQADLAYVRERVPMAFERTLEGVERVASIVRAMKEFAHPQSEQAPADLNRALATTLTVARNEYKYVAEVETELAELPPVVCNLSDLNQVFLNLIVNAAHAIEDAQCSSGEQGAIRIRTAREGESALVSVSDNGCGIPEEIRTRIFDPFFTTKAVGRGSGQGLAIARAVIDRHMGTLELDSEPGSGTTFTIRLPIAGAHATERPVAA